MLTHLHDILPFLGSAYNIRWRTDDQVTSSGKREAGYKTIREPLPDSLFQAHFEGKQAISVQPLIDGETCQWGCIDIDDYDHEDLLERVTSAIRTFNIKGYAENSKSGGVHIYILLERPVMAKPFRRALRKLATWIGFPNAEIRPAQDSIAINDGDLGSFIVLPCFDMGTELAAATLRSSTTTIEDFNALTDEGDFIDGPACLFPIQQSSAGSDWSQRNLYLYQLAVFYRYKFPGTWPDDLRRYNETLINPPLPGKEVEALIAQLEKNSRCHYICSGTPFDSVCNKSNCQVRKYGVAARDGFAGLISPEGITVMDTDPPTWFVTLQRPMTTDTVRVKLSTAQLQSVTHFKKRCIEVLKMVPTLPKQQEWEVIIAKLLESAEVVPVPFEMTEHAYVLELLYKFCLNHWKTQQLEGLMKGYVYVTEEENGMRAKFRAVDFTSFIQKARYKACSAKDTYEALQELSRLGKIDREKLILPPLELDVWSLHIDSRYLELKIDIDLEESA